MLNLKNTLDGYLKNVEVIGNTIQDENNLANIRSVGDKVEGQELYKIDVVSCGKNLFDKDSKLKFGYYYSSNGDIEGNGVFNDTNKNFLSEKFYEINSNTITWSSGDSTNIKHPLGLVFYTKDKNFISRHESTNIVNYKVPDNAKYFRIKGDYNRVDELQLEEGTVVTEYEAYQEDKLEILSPVQLEKVGDVADRIIYKDGVWGVEKQVITEMLNGTETWNMQTGTYVPTNENFAIFYLNNPQVKLSHKIMCDAIPSVETVAGNTNKFAIGGHSSVNGIRICIEKSKLSTVDLVGFKSWLQNEPITVKFISVQSQFIPLPHDQQVKLRTFAGQTNIAFNTETAGQIKAQVPKSLGAVVNTHTEQIEMLYNALKSVLAGDMYSLATILYPEDFEQTDNTEQDIMVIPE